MKTPCLLFAVFGLATSCATPSHVKADLTKIRIWSADMESAQPLPPPYVVDFESGARALTFVAVNHTTESESPSIKLVASVMDARRYGAVVLEGTPRSQGMSPASLKSIAEKDGSNGFFREGETSIAVLKAAKKAVPFFGGEPDEVLVKADVSAAGFTTEDLFCFYVASRVPQWRRDGSLSRDSFEENFLRTAPELGKRLGYAEKQEPSLEFFHRWYQNNFGKPFRAREVSAEAISPDPSGTLITQKISVISSRIRNQHMIRVTEEMLERYGRVLVIFESNHFPVQQLALESMLGKPTRISDQP